MNKDHTQYDQAQDALVSALVGVWRTCEGLPYTVRLDSGTTVNTGANLAECLSYALSAAAVAITKDLGGGVVDELRGDNPPGQLLVRHRPGSWEAQHVVALCDPFALEDVEVTIEA